MVKGLATEVIARKTMLTPVTTSPSPVSLNYTHIREIATTHIVYMCTLMKAVG